MEVEPVEPVVQQESACVNDLAACRAVLKNLHSLGIAHGLFGALRDTHFLITNDSQDTCALLHHFGGSFQTDDRAVLDAEMDSLEGGLPAAASEQLEDPPKQISIELSKEIRGISLRDNGLHPLVWDQVFWEDKITFTEAEHKEMLVDLRKNGWKGPVNVSVGKGAYGPRSEHSLSRSCLVCLQQESTESCTGPGTTKCALQRTAWFLSYTSFAAMMSSCYWVPWAAARVLI